MASAPASVVSHVRREHEAVRHRGESGGYWSVRENRSDYVTDDVANLTGAAPERFRSWAELIVSAF